MAKTKNNTKNNITKNNGKKNKNTIGNIKNNGLSLEMISILIICFSVLLIIGIFFNSGGILGKALSSFFKGLFGIGAYILPLIMITSSVYIFYSKNDKINIFKVILSILAFIFLISFFHLLTRQDNTSFSSYFTYLSSEYKLGKFFDGGVLGALIGDLLIKVIGVFTSYIVIIILFLACIFLLTGKSFYKTVYKGFKNLSNYFYYEYDIEEEEDEKELTINKNRKSIFSNLKNLYKNNKSYEKPKKIKKTNNYYENRPYEKPKNFKQQHTEDNFYNPVQENQRRTLKRYNNYIYDGVYKYRRIQKPTFFDIKPTCNKKEDKKIIFAIDEINNPEKYKNPINKNNNIFTDKSTLDNNYFKNNEAIYNTTKNIVENFENNIPKEDKEEDLFKIKSKEDYVNNVYKNKKENVDFNNSFDIDLEFVNNNIDEIFEKIPEEFLSNNIEEEKLDNIDNFYNFNNNIETYVNDASFENNINENLDESLDEEELSSLDDNNYIDLDEDDSINVDNDNNIDNIVLVDEDDDINNVDNYNNINTLQRDSITNNNLMLNNNTNKQNNKDSCPFDIDDIDEPISSQATYNHIKKDNEGFTIINKDNTNYSKDLENRKDINKLNNINTENINEPVIIKPDIEKVVTNTQAEKVDIKKEYIFPKLSFLSKNVKEQDETNDMELRENSHILVKTLKSFNVSAQVINISKGPSVTRYELSIEDGIKVSKILGLADNLALSLAATSIRIEAPIPGKSAVGIEIPNKEVQSVFLSEVICVEKFQKFPSKVAFGLGKDITGNVIVTDIAKMPHMLIAGATGSGKSVCINTLITSILYKANPDDVKLMMIDPKVVELSVYNGIPHLLTPVVTEPEKAAGVLNWAVSEMMDRYNLFAQTGTRNLVGYNSLKEETGEEKLPQIIIIIDELADLMMVAAKEVEASICRLAQLARAAGIHLIIATQRPSVDVITGLIKANIPSRIAFAVSSGTDSRTVLDTVGAEKLLGKGDMLFRSVDMNKPLRIQGAFISDKEVEQIVSFIKENSSPNYDENIINKIESSSKSNDNVSSDNPDEITEEVMAFLVRKGKASTSMIQRQFRIGYNRAARIIEDLEERGIVSSENGSKQRDVLMDKYQYEEYLNRYNNY